MIFLLAGTKDGRELGEKILEKNYPLIMSVTSTYGKNLIKQNENLIINDRPLNLGELENYLREKNVKILIDASHPYATEVSKNAMLAASKNDILYIRYEREKTVIDYDKIYLASDYNNAAELASNFGENIFLTTGSKTAKFFFEHEKLKDKRLIFRVLPDAKVLLELNDIGILPDNIIALKGPFTKELNEALFSSYKSDVIVTKDGGNIGGADTKIEAAESLNLPVVMIERPRLNYKNIAYSFDDVFKFITKNAR